MKKVILDLQIACKENNNIIKKKTLQHWLNIFIPTFRPISEITIRIVDIKEIKYLNMKYRKKNSPTNILSFPFKAPHHIKSNLIGDLVICQKIVEKEAIIQKKTFLNHLAHLIIHGCLHIFGYNHKNKEEEIIMKKKEKHIMKKLNNI